MSGVNVTNYDPTKVTVIVEGAVMTGFAEGSVITLARNGDIVTPSVGSQGDIVYSENADQSGTFTMSFQHTSAALPRLRMLAKSRKEISIVIFDANENGGGTTSADRCRILKVPDDKKEKAASSIDVSIFAPQINDQ